MTASMIDAITQPRPKSVQTRVVQVASTFTSRPLAKTLQSYLAGAGVADALEFIEYGKVAEFLLAPSADEEHSLGILVLIRVEDWLRSELKSATPGDSGVSSIARQRLTAQVDEFIKQIKTLAQRGRPIWLLACPSNGWIAETHQLSALCRTYANLLLARVRGAANVTVLNWPGSLSNSDINDQNTDRLGQIPFTRETFDQLGQILGPEIETGLATNAVSVAAGSLNGKADLANFLSGLEVCVGLARAGAADRAHVDRILRTAAAFSLKGENHDLTDAEVDGLIESGGCSVISVSDRLSSYGPSGVVSFRTDSGSLIVEDWALSCPVLGKQVEFAVLSGLSQIAVTRGCSNLAFEYKATGRNQIMVKFLESIADAESDGRFTVSADEADERIRKTAVAPGTWTLEFVT
jgi:hypothetical protein